MLPIVQLSFELPEPASDRLEQLLAEELERDAIAAEVLDDAA